MVTRARKVKAPPVIPSLANGMGDELLALEFSAMVGRCLRHGFSQVLAEERAAMLVLQKIALKAGHTVSQQGTATECAKCCAYGVVSKQPTGWLCSWDFSLRCAR